MFDNGLPLSPTDWIAEGRLQRLRYHRAGAARSGATPAGFIDNLTLEVPGASGSLEELVARTERGLLLTCLWYIREVDPATMLLTGLTRDGVYVVEDGRVVGATNNFRFNESPVDLLARVSEVGASVRSLGREFGEFFNRTVMPAAPGTRLQHELDQPGQLSGGRRPRTPNPPLCVVVRVGPSARGVRASPQVTADSVSRSAPRGRSRGGVPTTHPGTRPVDFALRIAVAPVGPPPPDGGENPSDRLPAVRRGPLDQESTRHTTLHDSDVNTR